MTKKIFLDPNEIRKKEILDLGTIPVNQYSKNFKESAEEFSADDLKLIFMI